MVPAETCPAVAKPVDGFRCALPILRPRWVIRAAIPPAGHPAIYDFPLISDFQKFRLPTDPNHFHIHHCPVPSEGRWPTSSTWGGMRWTRAARETSAVCWRTAKSCGSDAPMLASSLREEAQMTVSNKPGHRGEREVSRKTIARGMPGDFRCTCGDYTRVLTTHCTRGCGCIGHPAFPAPSVYRGALSGKARAHR